MAEGSEYERGWDDPATPEPDAAAAELRQLMAACGWQPGWPYCAAFVEAVWRTAYTELGAPATLLAELSQNKARHNYLGLTRMALS
jgi:hypothetical protein